MVLMARPKKDEKKRKDAHKKPGDPHMLTLRMTWGVFQGIEADAQKHFRSVNMHILWLIEQQLAKAKDGQQHHSSE